MKRLELVAMLVLVLITTTKPLVVEAIHSPFRRNAERVGIKANFEEALEQHRIWKTTGEGAYAEALREQQQQQQQQQQLKNPQYVQPGPMLMCDGK